MKLNKAQKELTKLLVKEMGLDFEFTVKGDKLNAKNSITINGYDDDVFVDIVVFESGSFGVDFVFDKLDMTGQNLALINEFNDNSVWLHAHIRNDGYLVLTYNIAQISDVDLVENTSFILNQLVSDKIKKYLQPITENTYPAN